MSIDISNSTCKCNIAELVVSISNIRCRLDSEAFSELMFRHEKNNLAEV